MIYRAYAHSQNCGSDICRADTFIRVKDIERINELKKELRKYGIVVEEESPSELETTVHLIVRIPYKIEIVDKEPLK